MAARLTFFANRPWARRVSLALGISLVSLLIVLVLVRILAATSIGRGFAQAQIENLSPAGQSIRIENISGDLLGRFEVIGLKVRDAEGLWLEADRIALEWSPMSLLWRHVKIDAVDAGTITLARRPEIEPAEDEVTKDTSSPDRRYSLDRLNIEALMLEEAVAGRAETFQINGDLATNIVSGQIGLNLTPASELGDRIAGKLGWSPTRPLNGTLTATSPESGMLRQLLEVQPAGRMDIKLNGEGSEEAWTAEATISVGGARYIDLSADGGKTKANARGAVDLSAFGAVMTIHDRLGGALDIEATYDDREHTLAADLASPNLSATARTRNPSRRGKLGDEPIDVTFQSANPAVLIGTDAIGLKRLSGAGALSAEDTSWTFDGSVEADSLEAAGFKAGKIDGPVTARFETEGQSLHIVTTLQTARFAGAPEALGPILGSSPKLTGDVTLDLEEASAAIKTLTVTGAGGSASADGTAALDLTMLDTKGRFSLSQPIAGITISRARWGLARNDGGPFAAALNGRIKLPETSEEAATWTNEPLDLSARIRMNVDGAIRLSNASLKNEALSLVASGDLAEGIVNASFTATARGGTLGGTDFDPLAADGTLSGPIDTAAFFGTITSPQISVSGETINNLKLRLNGALQEGGVASRVDLGARWRKAPLTLGTDAAYDDGNWTLGALEVAASELTVTGSASGSGADLGALQADLTLGGKLVLDDLQPEIEGTVVLASEMADIDLKVVDVTAGPAQVATLSVTGRGARTNFNGTLTSVGAVAISGTDQSYDLRVPIKADFEALSVELSPQGEIAGQALSTLTPVKLSRAEDRFLVAGALGIFGGRLGLDGEMGKDTLSASMDASELDLKTIALLTHTANLIGTAGLTAEVNSLNGKLVGTGRMTLDGVRREDLDVGEVNANFDIELAEETLTLTGLLVDEEVSLSLNVEATSPVRTSASPFSFSQESDAPLSLLLDGGGPIAPLWNLIGPPETRLEGDFTLDASVTGTRAAPAPVGRFELRNGIIEEGVLGLRLQDANLTADLDGDGIEVRNVNATGAKGGTLTGSGRYGFNDGASVKLTLNQLQALQRSDASAILSGTLEVTGAETGSRVQGDVEIERAEIDIEQLPTGGYTTLDVRFASENGETEEEAEPALPIILDISLHADRRIFVNGNGLKSEWRLDANIGGTATAPEVTGSASIVRGDIDLIGRNFQFTDATIRFNGDPTQPRLNINADRTAGDLTAGFAITGTLQAPEFELTSSPSLPDDEILSRVLFGRSPSELSAFEAAQLASAIAGLTGGGGFDLIGPLKDVLGVDRLDFGVGAGGAPTVGAGKYIANNVYVELRSSTRGAPGLSVEWTPRTNVEVVTDIEPDEAPRFTVQWKRDFDLSPPGRKTEDSVEQEGAEVDGTAPAALPEDSAQEQDAPETDPASSER